MNRVQIIGQHRHASARLDHVVTNLRNAIVGTFEESIVLLTREADDHRPRRVIVDGRLDLAATCLRVQRKPIVVVLREPVQEAGAFLVGVGNREVV